MAGSDGTRVGLAGVGAAAAGRTRDWVRRETLPHALLQVAFVALLLACAVYAVVRHATERRLVETHVLTARALALKGNPSDLHAALAELDALFAQAPDVPVAHALAADILTELWVVHRQPGTRVRAEAALARARALESRNGERFAAEALLMLDSGKVREADAFLTELERQGASSPKHLLARGQSLQALGRIAEARAALGRASEAGWQDPRYAVAYGEALLDDGRYPQAADAFARALTASSEHLGARTGALLTQVMRGDKLPEARRAVDTLLSPGSSLTPGIRARALAIRAELALAQRRTTAALEDVVAALALVPREPWALAARAHALALEGDPAARSVYEAAIARRGAAPRLVLEGARLLQEGGDGAGALALMDGYEAGQRALRLDSGEGQGIPALDVDDRYWLARGELLADLGQEDQALAAFDRAIAARGVLQARAQAAKGALLVERQEYEPARALLAPLAPMDGSGKLAEAYQAMSELHFAQGDFSAGCQHAFFALSRMEAGNGGRLHGYVKAVNQRLLDAGKAQLSRVWMSETQTLVSER